MCWDELLSSKNENSPRRISLYHSFLLWQDWCMLANWCYLTDWCHRSISMTQLLLVLVNSTVTEGILLLGWYILKPFLHAFLYGDKTKINFSSVCSWLKENTHSMCSSI